MRRRHPSTGWPLRKRGPEAVAVYSRRVHDLPECLGHRRHAYSLAQRFRPDPAHALLPPPALPGPQPMEVLPASAPVQLPAPPLCDGGGSNDSSSSVAELTQAPPLEEEVPAKRRPGRPPRSKVRPGCRVPGRMPPLPLPPSPGPAAPAQPLPAPNRPIYRHSLPRPRPLRSPAGVPSLRPPPPRGRAQGLLPGEAGGAAGARVGRPAPWPQQPQTRNAGQAAARQGAAPPGGPAAAPAQATTRGPRPRGL